MGELLKTTHRPKRNNAFASGGDVLATRVMVALLLISFYYLSYRYPFQINSSTSSPTYADTPTWLQLGKYALIAAVLALAAIVNAVRGARRETISEAPFVLTRLSFALLAGYTITKGIVLGSTDMLVLGSGLAAGFILSGLSLKWRIDAGRLTRVVAVFALLAIIMEAIQVFLFLSQGRLPALAYKNSISVRFGSLLDDPNGFALLVALALPVVFVAWKSRPVWRIVLCLALLVSLVLTQSFTGIAAVVLALLAGSFALNWRRPLVMAGFLILVPPVVLGVWDYVTGSAVVQSVWLTKTGSVNDHASSLDALGAMGVADVLGFGIPTAAIESSYVSMISSVGLPFTVMYIILGLFGVTRLHKTIKSTQKGREIALHYGAYFYLIAYLIGSINMQFSQVFPVDLLYIVAICISLFKTSDPGQAGRPLNRTDAGSRLTPSHSR